jgi:hypothetical protein
MVPLLAGTPADLAFLGNLFRNPRSAGDLAFCLVILSRKLQAGVSTEVHFQRKGDPHEPCGGGRRGDRKG